LQNQTHSPTAENEQTLQGGKLFKELLKKIDDDPSDNRNIWRDIRTSLLVDNNSLRICVAASTLMEDNRKDAEY